MSNSQDCAHQQRPIIQSDSKQETSVRYKWLQGINNYLLSTYSSGFVPQFDHPCFAECAWMAEIMAQPGAAAT